MLNISTMQVERLLGAVFLLVFKLQRKLKRRCRAIQWSCPTFLALFIIYAYIASDWIHFTSSTAPQWDMVIFTGRHNVSLTECSANTFATREGCEPCPLEMFSFPGWNECIPWLNCSEIAFQVQPKKRFTHGVTKLVWRAEWNGYDVVLINCSARKSKKENCLKGMANLKHLQGEFATRVIGNCPEKFQIVTMYYKHGTLRSLNKLLSRPELSHHNNIHTRFQLCVDYVRVLAYLHNSPIGVRVMCDTPFLKKLLDQYLITDDFHLVVNDVDGLEAVTKDGACHKRPANVSLQSQMEMESQEELPTETEPLNFHLRPAYDEKIDIWKIPWVVEKLLGKVKWSDFAHSQLRDIMEKCHAVDSRQRPSASEVLQEMLRVQELLSFSK